MNSTEVPNVVYVFSLLALLAFDNTFSWY